MLTPIFAFLIAIVASFVGSLQAGLVNTAVASYSYKYGQRVGLYVAVGGALPELIYCALAVKAVPLVQGLLTINIWGVGLTKIIGLAITIGLGIAALIVGLNLTHKKDDKAKLSPEADQDKYTAGAFWVGFSLGLGNPQLLIFWFGMAVWLRSINILPAHIPIVWDGSKPVISNLASYLTFNSAEILMVLGAGLGALLLLGLISLFTTKFRNQVTKLMQPWVLYLVAGGLLAAAIWQILSF